MLALWPERVLPLTRLAEAAAAPLSSTQGALQVLVADGLVTDEGDGKGRTYRLAHSDAVRHLVGLAISVIPVREMLGIVGRADPAVEFMALRGDELLVVFSATAGALEEARAA